MKIFIDAGHNDSKCDTGATGNGLREQDITYNVSYKLADKLKAVGIDVMLSRKNKDTILGTNTSTSLRTRSQMANQWGADLFISIHCNAYSDTSANGTEVYTYSETSKSYPLAENICNSLCKRLGTTNRGTKPASFAVLKQTNMPAMLIELAFITNPSNALLLKNKQDDFVDVIFNEICSYYKIANKNEVQPIINTDDVPQPFKYYVEGLTHVVEIDPRNIWAVETQCQTTKVPYNNFVNSIFFMPQANGIMYPQGIMVNAGQIISNNITHGEPVATLIVYDKNDVQLKYIDDITKEKNVWFAVSGYGVYPNVTAEKEGFINKFIDVLRSTDRPIIGYRKKDNKIVIAVRPLSTAQRAHQTAKNLGLDFAISLDGGGSTTLKVNGKYKFKGDGRKIFGGLIWS